MSGSMGGDNSLLMFPQLMGPQRQMMYGQALLGQAADVSPVRSPWQAAARAVSGLVGGYEMGAGQRGLTEGVQQMQAASDARLQALLGPDQNAPPAPAAAQPPAATPQPGAKPPPAAITEPPALSSVYDTAAASSGIPRRILVGQGHAESGFNNDAVSSSGAAGVPQILASTADSPGYGMTPLGAENRVNPDRAIPFAANYLAARGKDLYGDKWDPTDPTMMRGALQAYNGNSDPNYADKVFAAAGQAPPSTPSVIAATATSTLGPAVSTSDGMALAQRYERAAMALSGSLNPMDRMRATMLMQQAQFYRTQGAWSDPVQRPDGTMMQRNAVNGQVSVQGRPTVLFKDANGNMVDNSGRIVSKSNGYTATDKVSPDGSSQMVIGPDGKPEWIQTPQVSAETTQQQDLRTLTGLSPKMQAGTASPAETQQYNIAYSRVGKPELKWNEATKAWDTLPSTALPPGIYKPTGAMGGTAPAASAAPGAPAAPGAQPTSISPVSGVFTERATKMMDADDTTVRGFQAQTQEGERALADTQTVRSMMAGGAATGWGAEWKSDLQRTLEGMHVDPANIAAVTGINSDQASTQVYNKILFDLASQHAKSIMGSREASSALTMFRDAYPNIGTDPNATEAMTRFVDGLQYYARDKATAMANYQAHRVDDFSTGKTGPGQYRGLLDFNNEFNKTHDPRLYTAAALALARDQKTGGVNPATPYNVWSAGLNDVDKARALVIATRMSGNPNGVVVNLKHGAAPITAATGQQALQGVNAPADNPDFGLQ